MDWRSLQHYALHIGGITLSFGILFAFFNPASGYELSIYAESPVLMWASFAVAFSVAVISVFSENRRQHLGGVVLAALTSATVAAIPIIRSYYYYGNRDALTHLGYVKSYLAGSMAGESIIYPLTHVLATTIVRAAGISPHMSLMLLLPVFILVFVLSSYHLTRWLAGSKRAASVGLLVGCFLLPIVSIRLPVLYPIPNTLGVFYFLFIMYLGLKATHPRRSIGWFTALAVGYTAAIFLHPILTGVFIVVFLTVTTVNTQIGLKYKLALGAAISLWGTLWLSRFGTRLNYFIVIWIGKISGIGGDVSSAGQSLERIGISLFELALRLAAVKFLFLFVSIGLGIWLLYLFVSRNATVHDRRQMSITLGTIPIGVAVLVFFGVGLSNQWSRYLGFLLALATVLGAIGLIRLVSRVVSSQGRQTAAVVIAILIMTAPAALVIHSSPYLIRPSQQLTESQTSVYDHAFESQAPDVKIAGMSTVPKNFRHAHYGTLEAKGWGEIERNSAAVNDTNPPPRLAISHRTAYPNRTYLVVTNMSRQIHLELYQSEVQTKQDFEALETSPEIARIYDNGAEEQYLLK